MFFHHRFVILVNLGAVDGRQRSILSPVTLSLLVHEELIFVHVLSVNERIHLFELGEASLMI